MTRNPFQPVHFLMYACRSSISTCQITTCIHETDDKAIII